MLSNDYLYKYGWGQWSLVDWYVWTGNGVQRVWVEKAKCNFQQDQVLVNLDWIGWWRYHLCQYQPQSWECPSTNHVKVFDMEDDISTCSKFCSYPSVHSCKVAPHWSQKPLHCTNSSSWPPGPTFSYEQPTVLEGTHSLISWWSPSSSCYELS